MPFTSVIQRTGPVARLTLAGEVRGAKVADLGVVIMDVVVADIADEVIVDLGAVRFLDPVGLWALVCGYCAAASWGTTFRVVNLHGQALAAVQAEKLADVLADSRDLGALVLALAERPDYRSGPPDGQTLPKELC